MPLKKKPVEKMYYTIGEVSDMFKVNTSLIRYWEKEFKILKPKKNNKGNRLFTKQDVDNLHLIYHLVKEKGYTLNGAKDRLNSKLETSMRELEIVKSLKKIRETLGDIRDELDRAD